MKRNQLSSFLEEILSSGIGVPEMKSFVEDALGVHCPCLACQMDRGLKEYDVTMTHADHQKKEKLVLDFRTSQRLSEELAETQCSKTGSGLKVSELYREMEKMATEKEMPAHADLYGAMASAIESIAPLNKLARAEYDALLKKQLDAVEHKSSAENPSPEEMAHRN